MMHRLPPELSANEMPLLNEIQPDLHPSEVLFDVAKLLQPQTVRFRARLNQRVGRSTDHSRS